MSARPPRASRVIEGWAAFDARGNLLWDTLRPRKADTAQQFERFNPSVGGEPRASSTIRPVRIILAPKEALAGEEGDAGPACA